MTSAPESRSALTCGSSLALAPARRVAPKATSWACLKSISCRARAKNSVSRGLAPGQPPSMKPTPKSSRCRAMASLSATVRLMPSRCAPSRRVVSKTWNESSSSLVSVMVSRLLRIWISVCTGMTGSTVPQWSLALSLRLKVGQKSEKPLAGARGLRAGRGRRCPPVPGRTWRSLRTGAPAANNHGEREHGGSLAQPAPVLTVRLRMRARCCSLAGGVRSRRSTPLVSPGTSRAASEPRPSSWSPPDEVTWTASSVPGCRRRPCSRARHPRPCSRARCPAARGRPAPRSWTSGRGRRQLPCQRGT